MGRKLKHAGSEPDFREGEIYLSAYLADARIPQILITFERKKEKKEEKSKPTRDVWVWRLKQPIIFYHDHWDIQGLPFHPNSISFEIEYSEAGIISSFSIKDPEFEKWLEKFLRPIPFHTSISTKSILLAAKFFLAPTHKTLSEELK